MKKDWQILGIRLEKNVVDQLKDIADNEQRTLASYIRFILMNELSNHSKNVHQDIPSNKNIELRF